MGGVLGLFLGFKHLAVNHSSYKKNDDPPGRKRKELMTDARDPTFNGMPDVCFFLLVGHARSDLAGVSSFLFPISLSFFLQEREMEGAWAWVSLSSSFLFFLKRKEKEGETCQQAPGKREAYNRTAFIN